MRTIRKKKISQDYRTAFGNWLSLLDRTNDEDIDKSDPRYREAAIGASLRLTMAYTKKEAAALKLVKQYTRHLEELLAEAA